MLIKNATVVTESEMFVGDVLVDGGLIKEAGSDIECADAEVLDASGLILLPGAVDVHTHFDLDVGFTRSADDFYSGTVAAACGGTTSVVDHMAFARGDVSLMHQVEEYHRLAEGRAVIDYGFHGVLQKMNDAKLAEMREIADREGITSWKAYMTYGENMTDDAWMFKILRAAGEAGLVIPVHCENDGVIETLRNELAEAGHTEPMYHPLSRPAGAEAEAVSRLLHLAALAGEASAYIVHLSSRAGLCEVEKAIAAGQRGFGVETCTQYLTFTDEAYADEREGLKAVMSPPLRKREDIDALWDALVRGGVIDTVATDHCSFSFAGDKQLGRGDFRKCPNGAPGVEERLSVMYSEGVRRGLISLPQMVRYLCTEPARIFGLYPRKGAIMPGADADLVLLNPEAERTVSAAELHSACDYSCYEGMKLRGRIEKVYAGGRLIVENNRFLGKAGSGRYIRRERSSLVSR